MMAEKLNRLADMERLLRRVIELKPDHQHAYNALGYSLAERNVRFAGGPHADQKGARAEPGRALRSPTASAGSSTGSATATKRVRLLRDRLSQAQPDAEIAAHLGEVLWVTGQTRRGAAQSLARRPPTVTAANDVLRETLARLQRRFVNLQAAASAAAPGGAGAGCVRVGAAQGR